VSYNPVFISYAMVSKDSATLYTQAGKVTPEVAAQLQEAGVQVGGARSLASRCLWARYAHAACAGVPRPQPCRAAPANPHPLHLQTPTPTPNP
jgi:hypothetical protein